MSITLIARRALTTAATLALLAAAPGLTGVASASDHHGESRGESTCSASQLNLSVAQQTGVDAATTAYATSMRSAKDALKASMMGIRSTVMADPAVVAARTALIAAHDAYEAAEDSSSEQAMELAYENAEQAYRVAVKSARTTSQAAVDAAVTAYRTSVTAAETAYTAALTIVFGSVTDIPAQLVDPDGHDSRGHHGYDARNGHGNRSHDDSLGAFGSGSSSSAYDDCDDDEERGTTTRPVGRERPSTSRRRADLDPIGRHAGVFRVAAPRALTGIWLFCGSFGCGSRAD